MFNYKTTAHSEITKTNRNESVFIFYNPNDIHSFVSTMIIRNYFKLHNQLDKIEFLPVIKPGQLYVDIRKHYKELKDSKLIFIGCDVSKKLLTYYLKIVKSISVIDDYESSYKVANKAILDSIYPISIKSKVKFTYTPGFSIALSTWRQITNDEVPEFIHTLQELYNNKIKRKIINDYFLLAFMEIGNSFDSLQEYIEKRNYSDIDVLRKFYSTTRYVVVKATENIYKNSFAIPIEKYKAICTNANSNEADIVTYVALRDNNFPGDIVICFEKHLDFYKVIARASDPTINLLKVFEDYDPIGNPNGVHFHCEKFFYKGIK